MDRLSLPPCTALAASMDYTPLGHLPCGPTMEEGAAAETGAFPERGLSRPPSKCHYDPSKNPGSSGCAPRGTSLKPHLIDGDISPLMYYHLYSNHSDGPV